MILVQRSHFEKLLYWWLCDQGTCIEFVLNTKYFTGTGGPKEVHLTAKVYKPYVFFFLSPKKQAVTNKWKTADAKCQGSSDSHTWERERDGCRYFKQREASDNFELPLVFESGEGTCVTPRSKTTSITFNLDSPFRRIQASSRRITAHILCRLKGSAVPPHWGSKCAKTATESSSPQLATRTRRELLSFIL